MDKFVRNYSNGPDERPEPDADDLAELMDYYDGIAEELLLRHEENLKKIDAVVEDAGAAVQQKEKNE